MNITRKVINVKAPLTPEQLAELELADKMPIILDEDCTEVSEDQFRAYMQTAKSRNEHKQNHLVTISISNDSFNEIKKFGNGYANVLGRLVDMALKNQELVRKCL